MRVTEFRALEANCVTGIGVRKESSQQIKLLDTTENIFEKCPRLTE